ncbi:MAG TPA: NAD(P)H-binding protein, partial [Acidimicrobiales bacterium]|nr:NAD(P)H-binding protein [Acidimicrobiales bacterium]
TGLDDALSGVDAVVDVANVATLRRAKAEAFFAAVTRHLMGAAQRAGVAHYVVLSIVGIDRVSTGYYKAKQLQERLVLEGPVAATVVRATQFHEFSEQVSSRLSGPVLVVPDLRVQPVAAREVGEHLAGLAVGAPHGRAPDLAGPRPESLYSMIRALRRAQGDRRPILPVRLRVGPIRAAAGGGLIPETDGPRGTETFDQWLTARTGDSVG